MPFIGVGAAVLRVHLPSKKAPLAIMSWSWTRSACTLAVSERSTVPASTLPVTLPRTWTVVAVILPFTAPCSPIVTLPALMFPSRRPSIWMSPSVLMSPVMIRSLPRIEGTELLRLGEDDFLVGTSGVAVAVEEEEFVLLNIMPGFQKFVRVVNTALEVNFIM